MAFSDQETHLRLRLLKEVKKNEKLKKKMKRQTACEVTLRYLSSSDLVKPVYVRYGSTQF